VVLGAGEAMRRREFITIVGGATVAWPLAVRAQVSEREHRLGVLMSYLQDDSEAKHQVETFIQSFQQLGWTVNQNITIDKRWPGSNADQLRAGAVELVQLKPGVLLAGATPATMALKNQTTSIPIVFANVADPVGQGLVENLAQPGGNVTGFGAFEFSIAGKWIETLREIIPSAKKCAVIFNPETAPFYRLFLPFIQTGARLTGIETKITPIHEANDIASTIEKLVEEENAALIVFPGARFTAARKIIIETTARLRLPAVYPYSYYAQEGGLVSYGFDAADMYRGAAVYVDRILKGASVRELPVQQPTKFELAINLKTAKALGLTIPDKLLAIADEVIE
jgi:putative tryptophan/tyrosine transport system substrate-binding protein